MQNYTYKFNIKPNEEQIIVLANNIGCYRFVYNYFLDRSIKRYELEKKIYNYNENAKHLTELKQDERFSFLKNVNSQSLQQALKNLETALKNFFDKRAKFPTFKNKFKSNNSFRIPQFVKIVNGKLIIPKCTPIQINLHRKVEGKIKSCTISKSCSGKYCVSILVEKEIKHLPKTNKAVGIDLGIKTLMTLSSGETIENPKTYKKHLKKLKKQQKNTFKKNKEIKQEKQPKN